MRGEHVFSTGSNKLIVVKIRRDSLTDDHVALAKLELLWADLSPQTILNQRDRHLTTSRLQLEHFCVLHCKGPSYRVGICVISDLAYLEQAEVRDEIIPNHEEHPIPLGVDAHLSLLLFRVIGPEFLIEKRSPADPLAVSLGVSKFE
jgi:hypothetical protein